jgi:hypothetical protein
MSLPNHKETSTFSNDNLSEQRVARMSSSFKQNDITMMQQTLDAFSLASEHSMTYEADGSPLKVNLPILYLEPGEKIKVTIKKIKDEYQFSHLPNGGNFTPHPSYRIIKPKDPVQLEPIMEETTMGPLFDPVKAIFALSNFALTVFGGGAVFFLLLALFNVMLPQSDSFFGFFLFGMISLFFLLDRKHRRVINK